MAPGGVVADVDLEEGVDVFDFAGRVPELEVAD